jgi:hypothetical protein
MIIAEVKLNDGDSWVTRLFNCSMAQFRTMAERRYVAIGLVSEFSNEVLIQCLKDKLGWK